MMVRIALAQINTTVGDLEGNRNKILAGLEKARRMGVDLVVFPELAITGYPPEDLLLKPDFVESAVAMLSKIAPATKELIAVVGGLWVEDDLYNSAAVFANGQLKTLYHKHFLPNYGVFDENRYFQAGQKIRFSVWRGGVRDKYL